MKKKTKILGIILAVTLLLGSAFTVNAAVDTQQNDGNQQFNSNQQVGPNQQGAQKGKRPQMQPRLDLKVFFEELVEDGVINEDQKVAIEEKLQEKLGNEKRQKGEPIDRLAEDLATLIENGALSESKGKAIIEFMTAFDEERKAERELVQNMTEEERKAHFENFEPINPFDEMVAEGIITEEEKEAIIETLPPKPNHNQGPRQGNFQNGSQGNMKMPKQGGNQQRPLMQQGRPQNGIRPPMGGQQNNQGGTQNNGV